MIKVNDDKELVTEIRKKPKENKDKWVILHFICLFGERRNNND